MRARRRGDAPETTEIGMIIALALVATVIAVFAMELIRSAEREAETVRAPEAAEVSAVATRQTVTEAECLTVEETPEEQETVESRYNALAVSEDDIYILACLIYHEARGECFDGQVAVAEVVLNRCISEYFPDTVESVVFQKYGDVWQFSPAPYLYSAEPGEEQYRAAYTALEEREYILSEDTVYFSTRPYNDSIDKVIGNHYFCRIF